MFGKKPFLITLAVFLSTCFGQSLDIQSKLELLPVPIVRQSTSYSCGSASLLSVLYYWKVSTEAEQDLFRPLQTDTEFGTHPVNLTEHAKTYGLKAELKTNTSLEEIESAIKKGEPVIVDFQAWGTETQKLDYSSVWDSGHYGVVVGFDDKYLYLMDPVLGSSYGKVEKEDFLKRWHDYETRNGKFEYYIQAAIFISGKEKLSQFPGAIPSID
jgi:predicted double-glycine peptidase